MCQLGGPPPKAPPGGSPKGGPPKGGPPKGGLPGKGSPGLGSRADDPLMDWKNVVGTGPWVLTNFVDGSSLNYKKNPKYWGFDERHPQNRLPYADNLNVLVIPDDATALAALRTGKIDILSGVGWQMGKNLARTNKDMQQSVMPSPGSAALFNLNNKPFDDIRVRKALQMAINREAIAKSLYGGIVQGTPCGQIHPELGEFCFAYKDWPRHLQEEYCYNPQKAKELLKQAGYPDGFKTNLVSSMISDTYLIQAIKSQFMDIGVDMDVRLYDQASAMDIIHAVKHDQMAWAHNFDCGNLGMPWFTLILGNASFFPNPSSVKDPVFDDMMRKCEDVSEMAEVAQLCRDAQKRILENHYKIYTIPIAFYNINQSYLKGYSGEHLDNPNYFARWWTEK